MEIKFDCVNIITTIADTPWIVNAFINELRRLIVHYNDELPTIGVDIMLDPNSSCNLHHNKAAATLQLCYRTNCIIIQLLHLDIIPVALKTFLMDRNIKFVSYKLCDRLSKLRVSYGINIEPLDVIRNRLDYTGTDPFSTKREDLVDLAQRVRIDTGLDIARPSGASSYEWGARNLTEEQIKYAAICAYSVVMLGMI